LRGYHVKGSVLIFLGIFLTTTNKLAFQKVVSSKNWIRKHIQIHILALVMNQILNLIDAKGVDDEFLELHQGPTKTANDSEHQ